MSGSVIEFHAGILSPEFSLVNGISRMIEIGAIPSAGIDMERYIDKSGYMESEQAILALAALAQSTRLDVFRLLAKHEPEGLAAGDIAKALAVPQNTMSSHLGILSRAGLVTARRISRSIVYRADLKAFQAVVLFMLRDCCDGRPEICGPLIEDLTPCCPPKPRRKANA
jgi:ArsR family transcriptional regulator, arsenate/arsenite/antimonite-responsive transcriptional repressor